MTSVNIENLRKQAKSLSKQVRDGDAAALARVRSYFEDEQPGLQDVQMVIAREYGFPSWTRLIQFAPKLGVFPDRSRFVIQRTLQTDINSAWEAISSPDGITHWMFPGDFERRLGAAYSFVVGWEGTIGEYQSPSFIRFDYSDRDGYLRFSLSSSGGHVVFCLEDQMPESPTKERKLLSPVEVWRGVTSGWHQLTDSLECYLCGSEPPQIEYDRLCRFYDHVLMQDFVCQ